MSKWTTFWDMYSGGGQKHDFKMCFIEAPQDEAKRVFYSRFGTNPNRVTCTCCGEDYSISENESLEQATGFHRGCAYVYRRPDGTVCPEREGFIPGRGISAGYTVGYEETPRVEPFRDEYVTLDNYITRPGIVVIRAHEIRPEERTADVPIQGYVWEG